MRVLICIAGFVITNAVAFAQPIKEPAPRDVAPEFREAAEKRALEKRKLDACQQKADVAKVLTRDRAKFIIECLDK